MSTATSTTMSSIRSALHGSALTTKSIDYIGFANIPNQVFRRCIKDGFDFTIMVVGQSGLGKSTFLNTLFLTEIHDLSSIQPLESQQTVNIEQRTVRLVEKDVKLNLTVVDTPGFGDLVNNTDSWKPIVKFIDSKFEEYLIEETKIDRLAVISDRRVHLCLYFIAPSGHSLKPLDIELLRTLQNRVNIIPVIAKADTLTREELQRFKQNILDDLKKYNIQIYEFPQQEPLSMPGINGSSKENRNVHVDIRSNVPFAIVGSTKFKEDSNNTGRRIRVRDYPWGTVEVDNQKHNDFIALRDMIIQNYMIDLIEVTNNIHYENFRVRSIPKNSNFENDPLTQFEKQAKEKLSNAQKDRNKREELFKQKIAEREERISKEDQQIAMQELENQKIIDERKALMERIQREVTDLRSGRVDSTSSIVGGTCTWNSTAPSPTSFSQRIESGSSLLSSTQTSPTEKTKKKGGFFKRN